MDKLIRPFTTFQRQVTFFASFVTCSSDSGARLMLVLFRAGEGPRNHMTLRSVSGWYRFC